MKVVPKEFQVETIGHLREAFFTAQAVTPRSPAAVLLNAPTGSGKTIMATALIDELLGGSDDGTSGDPDLIFIWLTDQPELNRQTLERMKSASSQLLPESLIVVDAGVNAEVLSPGCLYFLNTQKLGSGTTFVRPSDGRPFTLWETIDNTIAADPERFVLIIDEAHRGAKGKEAEEADTIMQTFLKGGEEISAVPLVLGISATPDRFVKLCNDTNRPLFRVDVDPEVVRESGLLKEYVDLYHPDQVQPSDATMLREATAKWRTYCDEWDSYTPAEGEVVPEPILLVQVEDARANSGTVSRTDLEMVVSTLVAEVPHDHEDTSWIAHSFQESSDLVIGGRAVRYLAPSDIDSDREVKVVLFKSSLNTGWDCPRAETMVSFRSARDETNIAQLVGRMVRAPMARRVDGNEHLNSVALYLPFFDQKTVEKVVIRLTGDPSTVPPTKVRLGGSAVTLRRNADHADCFAALAQLPTYTVPRSRPVKPVPRLAKLADLLGDLGLVDSPIRTYRSRLVEVLLSERDGLVGTEAFATRLADAAVLNIRRRRVDYAAVEPSAGNDAVDAASIADENLDDLFAASGRQLGEGLHQEYLRRRRLDGEMDSRAVKVELHALLASPGVLDAVMAAADQLRREWTDSYKSAVASSHERYRQVLRDIDGAGTAPELTTLEVPSSIESRTADFAWPKHLFVETDGFFREDFRSSWERKVVASETARPEIVGWLRNQDRKPWSLCIKRREGTKWVGIYPDFIFFKMTPSGLLPEIVDPHLLADPHAPARAAALAGYAKDHGDQFGRIELVIFERASDDVGKRLNLMDELVREEVALVTSHAHLKSIFDRF